MLEVRKCFWKVKRLIHAESIIKHARDATRYIIAAHIRRSLGNINRIEMHQQFPMEKQWSMRADVTETSWPEAQYPGCVPLRIAHPLHFNALGAGKPWECS